MKSIGGKMIKVLLLILVGCSTIKPVPKELVPYVELFKRDVLTNDSDRAKVDRIEFVMEEDKDSHYAAMCYPITWTFGVKIIVNRINFDRVSEASNMSTIIHEMSHAVCHLAHTEPSDSGSFGDLIEKVLFKMGALKELNRLYDGCPGSVMHPTEFSDRCFIVHYIYYINELKERCR